ncbi:putative disease resistance protein RGA3 [Ziziphus jujuba]|uniref:Disease resistance protein RGA3 n=1 Tax=Ziziphus jujuba TaxID=326968 RepID=A0ABM3ZYT0_ZIZJJ|nr:putative disease resistance protein RGA3 [Ziziphus jujuba]
MEGLHSEVWRLLHNKRYLIVLDDVWTDDQENWDKLKPLFGGVVGGSQIIITTRSQRAANMMNSPTFPYILEGLSEDACWSLLKQRAFRIGEEKKHPDLLPIGREIVKKCGGVPLAAKTLESLMLLKRERREWLVVQDSELWNLDKSENGILPALKLSYHHLSCCLKRCFSFCSIIPRGYEINKEKLIHQWMAAELLQFGSQEETPEDIGNDYFNYLISFFQDVKNCDVYGVHVGYKMHDLIYDLAQSRAGIDSVIMNHGFSPKLCSEVLHSSVVCNSRASSMIPEASYKAKHLPTLLLFSNGDFAEVPSKVFSSFECLRELGLSRCGLVVLDGSIGEHLLSVRYLNLSHTHIKELPCSIENLR